MNEEIPKEIPKIEEAEALETQIETPAEATEQRSVDEEVEYQEASVRERKKVAEELPLVRESLGLNPNGPDIKNTETDSLVVEDLLAKAKAKGLVFEMDEIEDTPEFREKLKERRAEQDRLKGEKLYKAADEEMAIRNSTSEKNKPEIETSPIEAAEKPLITREDALTAGVKLEEVETIEHYTQAGKEREDALRGAIDRVKIKKE